MTELNKNLAVQEIKFYLIIDLGVAPKRYLSV